MWTHIHGGATHFPIALLVASVLFDGLAMRAAGARRGELRAAAFYSLVLAAAGAVGAIVSGLILCKGNITLEGALGMHHRFVWPASALLIGLAAFRIWLRTKRGSGEQGSKRTVLVYFFIAIAASALICAAGYWGGEMLG